MVHSICSSPQIAFGKGCLIDAKLDCSVRLPWLTNVLDFQAIMGHFQDVSTLEHGECSCFGPQAWLRHGNNPSCNCIFMLPSAH